MQLSVASDDRKKKRGRERERKEEKKKRRQNSSWDQDTGCDARHLANSTRLPPPTQKITSYLFYYSSRKWLSFVLPLHVWLYTKCVKKKPLNKITNNNNSNKKKKGQGRSGRTALQYRCVHISDTVRDFGGKKKKKKKSPAVFPSKVSTGKKKLSSALVLERVRGGESSLPVPFATMCQKERKKEKKKKQQTCEMEEEPVRPAILCSDRPLL